MFAVALYSSRGWLCVIVYAPVVGFGRVETATRFDCDSSLAWRLATKNHRRSRMMRPPRVSSYVLLVWLTGSACVSMLFAVHFGLSSESRTEPLNSLPPVLVTDETMPPV